MPDQHDHPKLTAQDWFAAPVDFGGEAMSRAEVYEWFRRRGYERRAADRWLQGYDLTHGRR
jgi:hypothetical protein